MPLDRVTGGETGRAEFLGWQDDEALYLLPETSWHAVTRYCRDTGELFPIREDRLRRDLVKEGLAEGVADRHTATVRIDGRPRRVLRVRRPAAEEIVGEAFPEPPETGETGPER